MLVLGGGNRGGVGEVRDLHGLFSNSIKVWREINDSWGRFLGIFSLPSSLLPPAEWWWWEGLMVEGEKIGDCMQVLVNGGEGPG